MAKSSNTALTRSYVCSPTRAAPPLRMVITCLRLSPHRCATRCASQPSAASACRRLRAPALSRTCWLARNLDTRSCVLRLTCEDVSTPRSVVVLAQPPWRASSLKLVPDCSRARTRCLDSCAPTRALLPREAASVRVVLSKFLARRHCGHRHRPWLYSLTLPACTMCTRVPGSFAPVSAEARDRQMLSASSTPASTSARVAGVPHSPSNMACTLAASVPLRSQMPPS